MPILIFTAELLFVNNLNTDLNLCSSTYRNGLDHASVANTMIMTYCIISHVATVCTVYTYDC